MTWTKKTCPYCGRRLPINFWRNKKKSHGLKILESLKARAEKGLPVGRTKLRNDAHIIGLRKQGYSIRRIAKQLGYSHSSVEAALKSSKRAPLDAEKKG